MNSPQNLVANAASLGMVIATDAAYLRLADGAVIPAPAQEIRSGCVTMCALIGNDLTKGLPLVKPAAATAQQPAVTGAPGPGTTAGGATTGGTATGAANGTTAGAHHERPHDRADACAGDAVTTSRRGRARITMAVLAVFAIVAVFMIRLVDIQIVQADDLNSASYDKRAVPMTLYGTRGSIVDANGNVLALSVDRYDITASPRVALSVESDELNGPAAQAINQIAAVTGTDPAAMLAALMADPQSDFMYLAQGVTLEVYREVRELDIPWVNFELRQSRTYPNGAVAGNLVGFIGTDGPQEGLEVSENECLVEQERRGGVREGRGRRAAPRLARDHRASRWMAAPCT